MKKTVTYKGEKIKIDFEKANHTRVIDEKDGISIVRAHGTHDFIINGKAYTTEWKLVNKNKSSVTRSFEGFTCGDSEKKIAEHIISKYGL